MALHVETADRTIPQYPLGQLLLVRVEQGSLRWSVVRSALWLRAPMDPNTGRRGGRVWWWVLPTSSGSPPSSSSRACRHRETV